MKKSIILAAAAALLSVSSIAPAQAGAAMSINVAPIAQTDNNAIEKVGSRRRNRHLGYGAAGLITLGVIGAIAANRAHSRPYYRDRYENQCRVWRRRCYNGNDRACWNFDRRC